MVLRTKLNPGVSLHVDFSLQVDKVALLVIDVQEYVWLANTAHDHFCNNYDKGLEKISALSKEFRRVRDDESTMQGGEVVFSYYQSLTANKRDVSLDVKLSGDRFGLFPGPTTSNLFLQQCKPVKAFGKGDIQMPKTSTSVFQSTNLNYVLRNLGIEQLVITGFLTEQGIEAAARDAADLGYFVTVVRDACTAQTMEKHESGLRNIEHHARILNADAIIHELRLDFAEKKAGAAGTSVLETSAAEKQEAAFAVVEYLRSEGLDKAAEMTETHFIGTTAKRYVGASETVGVPVEFGATVSNDVMSERFPRTNDPDIERAAPAAKQTQMNDHDEEEDNNGEPDGTSSFLSIEKDESLHQCAKLADEHTVEEEDSKPPAVEIGMSEDGTASGEMPHSSDGLNTKPDGMSNLPEQAALPEQADLGGGVDSQMDSTSMEPMEEKKNRGFASKIDDGSFRTALENFELIDDMATLEDGRGVDSQVDSTSMEPMEEENKSREFASKINDGSGAFRTAEEKFELIEDKVTMEDGSMPGVDGGSMETASGATARAHFQSGAEKPMDLLEEPMPGHAENELTSNMSVASARSKDPDGSFGRDDPPIRHHRNSSSFSNFGSSSSIPNVETQPEPEPPTPANEVGMQDTTPMGNGVHPESIPEEDESGGTDIVSRMMRPFNRRRVQADPPANRFHSQSIIGDPTKM